MSTSDNAAELPWLPYDHFICAYQDPVSNKIVVCGSDSMRWATQHVLNLNPLMEVIAEHAEKEAQSQNRGLLRDANDCFAEGLNSNGQRRSNQEHAVRMDGVSMADKGTGVIPTSIGVKPKTVQPAELAGTKRQCGGLNIFSPTQEPAFADAVTPGPSDIEPLRFRPTHVKQLCHPELQHYQWLQISLEHCRNSYFEQIFDHLQQHICRQIAKCIIKLIEPRKQVLHPYKGISREGVFRDPEASKPDWWPPHVRHKEPDHLYKEERINLLVHLVTLKEARVRPGSSFNHNELAFVLDSLRKSLDPAQTNLLEEFLQVLRYLELWWDGKLIDDKGPKIPIENRDSWWHKRETHPRAVDHLHAEELAAGNFNDNTKSDIIKPNYQEPLLLDHSTMPEASGSRHQRHNQERATLGALASRTQTTANNRPRIRRRRPLASNAVYAGLPRQTKRQRDDEETPSSPDSSGSKIRRTEPPRAAPQPTQQEETLSFLEQAFQPTPLPQICEPSLPRSVTTRPVTQPSEPSQLRRPQNRPPAQGQHQTPQERSSLQHRMPQSLRTPVVPSQTHQPVLAQRFNSTLLEQVVQPLQVPSQPDELPMFQPQIQLPQLQSEPPPSQVQHPQPQRIYSPTPLERAFPPPPTPPPRSEPAQPLTVAPLELSPPPLEEFFPPSSPQLVPAALSLPELQLGSAPSNQAFQYTQPAQSQLTLELALPPFSLADNLPADPIECSVAVPTAQESDSEDYLNTFLDDAGFGLGLGQNFFSEQTVHEVGNAAESAAVVAIQQQSLLSQQLLPPQQPLSLQANSLQVASGLADGNPSLSTTQPIDFQGFTPDMIEWFRRSTPPPTADCPNPIPVPYTITGPEKPSWWVFKNGQRLANPPVSTDGVDLADFQRVFNTSHRSGIAKVRAGIVAQWLKNMAAADTDLHRFLNEIAAAQANNDYGSIDFSLLATREDFQVVWSIWIQMQILQQQQMALPISAAPVSVVADLGMDSTPQTPQFNVAEPLQLEEDQQY